MANPYLDTTSQRPVTGLDKGARHLIVGVLDITPGHIVMTFFQDAYAGFEDYYSAAMVWGCQRTIVKPCSIAAWRLSGS
jgi:hypothetical protein